MSSSVVSFRTLALIASIALSTITLSSAAAQSPGGYHLSLFGSSNTMYGAEVNWSGTAYKVRGLAELSPMSSTKFVVKLMSRSRSRTVTEHEQTVKTDSRGRFVITIPIPDRALSGPYVEVILGSGKTKRVYTRSLQVASPLQVRVLSDRKRYEPGELVHIWAMATHSRSGKLLTKERFELSVRDPQGNTLVEKQVLTSAAGVVAEDLELPASARDGAYSVRLSSRSSYGASVGQHYFEVNRRTTERMIINIQVDQASVRPGAKVTGRVYVKNPSGAAVANTVVSLRLRQDGALVTLRTNRNGIAKFDTKAPGYLSGDMATHMISASVNDPNHGALQAVSSYIVARVKYRVEAIADGGALVPEVDGRAFVAVIDAKGDPAPAGLSLVVSGPGVARGNAEVKTDSHGLAMVPMRIARGMAGPSANCGNVATRISVKVVEEDMIADTCVRVAPKATLSVQTDKPVVGPGESLTVSIARRPSVKSSDVLIELIAQRVVIDSFWLAKGKKSMTVTIPANIAGVIEIRARPAMAHNVRRKLSERGGTALGTGSLNAVLVRPADAFGVSLSTGDNAYQVRSTANLSLKLTGAKPQQAFAAIVARDLTQHGGEQNFELKWLNTALRGAVIDPETKDAILLLRSAVGARVSSDIEMRGVPPLLRQPWESFAGQNGDALQDPISERDNYLRNRVGNYMVQIERLIENLGEDTKRTKGVVVDTGGRRRFDPYMVENLKKDGRLRGLVNLGGQPITISMIKGADSTFTFDAVAKRIARKKLIQLMTAVSRLTAEGDVNAARASAGQAPSRWLGRLVQIGALQQSQLIDPWGNPFVFRPGRPLIVLSSRAPTWELLSAGPDGRVGTGDDIRNPFARVVKKDSLYALRSGEDALMLQLSLLGPGNQTLAAMLSAYKSVSLAEISEKDKSVTKSGRSQSNRSSGKKMRRARSNFDADDSPRDEEEMLAETEAAPLVAVLGGDARGYGAGAMADGIAMEPPPAPKSSMAPARPVMLAKEDSKQEASKPVSNAMNMAFSNVVRQDFPATLFFKGQVDLQGETTEIPIKLQDALTTYRVEAIAWTPGGWITTAQTELRVDQAASVSAAIPPFASVGDILRVPVRVTNRTAKPLTVKIKLAAEGVDVAVPATRDLELPPLQSKVTTVELRLAKVGEGSMVVQCQSKDGKNLDAIRQPIRIWPDARLVRESLTRLAIGSEDIKLKMPSAATERGPATLSVVSGPDIFGGIDSIGSSIYQAWTKVLLKGELRKEEVAHLRSYLEYDRKPYDNNLRRSGVDVVYAIGAAWGDQEVPDGAIERALRRASQIMEQSSRSDARGVQQLSQLLIGLAPAVRMGGRMAPQADLDRLVSETRKRLGDNAAELEEDTTSWVHAAVALSFTARGRDNDRANELLRRAKRSIVYLGDEAFLDDPAQNGSAFSYVETTALMAIAKELMGERQDAMRFVRFLANVQHRSSGWNSKGRAVAVLAAGMVGGMGATVTAIIDGKEMELGREIGAVEVEGLGKAGTHVIAIKQKEDSLAIVKLNLRYGMPWDAAPAKPLMVEMSWDGETGARDTRSALRLTVRNRSIRFLRRPVVEVDLPAGTEFDEPTREFLKKYLRETPSVEGRTIRLPLKPLAPGSYVRLPLPLRWSVGGTLRGLGAVALDEDADPAVMRQPASVLKPSSLSIADEGPEPERLDVQEAVDGGPPTQPVPPPIIIEDLAPRASNLNSQEVRTWTA